MAEIDSSDSDDGRGIGSKAVARARPSTTKRPADIGNSHESLVAAPKSQAVSSAGYKMSKDEVCSSAIRFLKKW